MFRVLFLDLPIEIFLHGEVIHILPEKVPVHITIPLPVKVKTDIVDKPAQIDIVLRFHNLSKRMNHPIFCVIVAGTKVHISHTGLNQLLSEIHRFVCPVVLLDPKDDRDAVLILPAGNTMCGEQLGNPHEQPLVLLPVAHMLSGFFLADGDVVPAHIRKGRVLNHRGDKVSRLLEQSTNPVYLLETDKAVL